jgi:5-methyltetrahydrofolate--homocysteine methyltransferase
MSTRFLDALKTGRVLLMDGAMGTELIRRGLKPNEERTHEWNRRLPTEVEAIHHAYLQAGARCLLTNTFAVHQGNAADEVGSWEGWRSEFQVALKLARSAGQDAHFMLLDVGPGNRAELLRRLTTDAAYDGTLFETLGSLQPLVDLLEIASFQPGPCLVSFAFTRENGALVSPQDKCNPENIAGFVERHRERFTALGVNCGREMDMEDVIEVVRRYRRVTDLPILARPNAGTPIRIGDRWVYPHSPQSMAARLPELIDAGATLIGGCCGTTPQHIAAFREVIDRLGVGWKP